MGLALRGRMEDAAWMKAASGRGASPRLSQGLGEEGGQGWAAPQIFISLISSFLLLTPIDHSAGATGQQGPQWAAVTCIGSGASQGVGEGRCHDRHHLDVQLPDGFPPENEADEDQGGKAKLVWSRVQARAWGSCGSMRGPQDMLQGARTSQGGRLGALSHSAD